MQNWGKMVINGANCGKMPYIEEQEVNIHYRDKNPEVKRPRAERVVLSDFMVKAQ